jgi:hypothetical protein
VIRKGYELAFTIDDFRRWFLQQLGGTEGGVTRCAYCNQPIDAYSAVIDHATPLKRGGAPDLSNLVAACASDNDIKGQLTADEYRRFIEKMRELEIEFGPAPVKNITARLESQTKLAAQARWNQAKEARKKADQVAEAMEAF